MVQVWEITLSGMGSGVAGRVEEAVLAGPTKLATASTWVAFHIVMARHSSPRSLQRGPSGISQQTSKRG
jgi:hypothetical protein